MLSEALSCWLLQQSLRRRRAAFGFVVLVDLIERVREERREDAQLSDVFEVSRVFCVQSCE